MRGISWALGVFGLILGFLGGILLGGGLGALASGLGGVAGGALVGGCMVTHEAVERGWLEIAEAGELLDDLMDRLELRFEYQLERESIDCESLIRANADGE